MDTSVITVFLPGPALVSVDNVSSVLLIFTIMLIMKQFMSVHNTMSTPVTMELDQVVGKRSTKIC